MTEDSVDEVYRGIGSGDRARNRNEIGHLVETVDKHLDTRASLRIGWEPKIKSIDTERHNSMDIGKDHREPATTEAASRTGRPSKFTLTCAPNCTCGAPM
ncbi:hypothetical protein PC116_g23393 [Phytophthora cactorum]|nr:hypothetical protein PC116_g23393 [Phytophthora cactorum]